MIKVNRYCHHSHISERNFRRIIKYYAIDKDASEIAELTGISRNSVNRILRSLRMRLVKYCDNESPISHEIEVNAGGKKLGLGGRISAFLKKKHQRKVNTEIISYWPRDIIYGKPEDLENRFFCFNSDYIPLIPEIYYRVKHDRCKLRASKAYVKSIEDYWDMVNKRRSKFRGISQNTLDLHLKEVEFRFIHKDENLYKLILRMLQKDPIRL